MIAQAAPGAKNTPIKTTQTLRTNLYCCKGGRHMALQTGPEGTCADRLEFCNRRPRILEGIAAAGKELPMC